MPPRLSVGAAAAAPAASKILKKDRIVQALSRMNDRDTQKAAAEELASIVVNMDQEGLLIIISGLCTTGSEHKVFARKECARAIGIIASEACPLREQALQQPHLGKMLGQLRKLLQDPDSSVREASSEALALVAKGLAHVDSGAGPQGTLNNPVVKLIFDCLAEQRKELNAAACSALGLAAPFLGTLEISLSRELVRKLNSPAFQAPAALLAALARSDPATGEPIGLIKSGPAAFFPVLSALVGQPAPPSVTSSSGTVGSGVAGALSRPDWPVRLAAADMLRSTALLLGPFMEMDGCWARGDAKSVTGRAIKALESCKFDKVRDVRDVARNALAVLEDLYEYGSGGGSTAGWPAHIAAKLCGRDPPPAAAVATSTFVLPFPVDGAAPGRKSPLRRSAVSPPGRRPRTAQPPAAARASNSPPPGAGRSSPPPAERRSSPMLARGGSVSERFRAAHRDGDVVSVRYLGGVESAPLPGTTGEEVGGGGAGGPQLREAESVKSAASAPARAPLQDDTAPDALQGSRRTSRQPSKASESAWAVDRPLSLEPQPADDVHVRAPHELLRNLALGGDAAAVLGADGLPTFTQPYILKSSSPRPASEVAAWAAADALKGPPEFLAQPAATTGSAPAPLVSPAAGSGALGGPASVSVPLDEWLAAQQRLHSLEEQQRQLLEAFNAMSEQNKQTIAGLQDKVSCLEAALEAAQAQVAAQQLQQQQHQQRQQELLEQQVDEPSLAEADVSWMSRTIRPGSPLMPPTTTAEGGTSTSTAAAAAATPTTTTGAAPDRAMASPRSGAGLDPEAASEARQAYREVLAGGRLSDMQLLRLMVRTGPIWGDLGPELSAQLLAAFTASLQQARADGPMLTRMVPWLYRLVDDKHVVYEPPVEMRAPLLAALRSTQASVTDPALNEKVVLLINTMRTYWSLWDAPAAAGPAVRQLTPPPLPPPPSQQSQPSPAPFLPQGSSHQELSFGIGQLPLQQQLDAAAHIRAAAAAAIAGWGASFAAHGGSPDVSGGAAQAAAALAPAESHSPGLDGLGPPTVTPRVTAAAVRSSQGRSPSIGALMGQWSDLQRDFAAMSSPNHRPQSRGQ
ncbi:hypothetical protein PLESTB_000476100 [Pleodorina starrii]|uniref:TORTIFOLIA1/SINE1-2 N-terminal domain-containing protein n=1 Tax=Pleodorina starrii TaxID=330485 RepID=A0A9W6F0C1_9CHLO|nr:hypothetical protein PLESTB_000476100 [Pleodorina starrii]GLC63553.1 hypothetical protein PLESTF_000048600 [Pleodorina starrii]